MITVFLKGLEIYAFLGVPPEERAIGHRYTVDVQMEVQGAADYTDQIEDTVDYAAVGRVIQDSIQDAGCRTVERAARLAAERVLSEFALIRAVTLTLSKNQPPTPLIVDSCGAVVSVHR